MALETQGRENLFHWVNLNRANFGFIPSWFLYFHLDFGDESKKPKKEEKANAEEKKKNIKALIDKIPTEKDALFAYEVDWEMVDTVWKKHVFSFINVLTLPYL